MEKNYITMSRELEKLRSELTKTANVDIRNGNLVVSFAHLELLFFLDFVAYYTRFIVCI
jgi:hypothetical protein